MNQKSNFVYTCIKMKDKDFYGNCIKVYQFKVKDSKSYPLHLVNISKRF